MNRKEFETAYANRSDLTWAAAPDSQEAKIIAWSSKVLLLAISAEFAPSIQSLFDRVNYQDGYVSPRFGGFPADSFAGVYKDTAITVMHLGITPGARGSAYMDMALERLRPGTVKDILLIGECTSLQKSVDIGDCVVPVSSIRKDDIHLSYYPAEVPAMADPTLSQSLTEAARVEDAHVHVGVSLSCSAGAGVFDPALLNMVYRHHQMGVLANTVEASCAYLLGELMGNRVSSIWLVADSLFKPLPAIQQSPRLGWKQGWERVVRIALDTLVSMESVGTV